MSGNSARVGNDRKIDLGMFIANRVPPPDSLFELTSTGALLSVGSGFCLTVTKLLYVVAEECRLPLGDRQVGESCRFDGRRLLSSEIGKYIAACRFGLSSSSR